MEGAVSLTRDILKPTRRRERQLVANGQAEHLWLKEQQERKHEGLEISLHPWCMQSSLVWPEQVDQGGEC